MQRLEVQNLALIDSLELELGTGFNVFTGETGAGKSIIVDAIWMLTGARADAELVRSGADSLLVSGFWNEVTLSRRVSSAGRGVARVDGEVVSNRELAEAASCLVTVHWQHAAQALLDPKYHRDFLDASLKDKTVLEVYERTYQAFLSASTQLERLRESERERARRLDLLSYQLREIDEAKIKVNEEETLRLQRERLLNAERIAQDLTNAAEALEDDGVSAVSLLAEAVKALTNAGRFDPNVAQLATDLREALTGVQAVAGETRDLAENAAADPKALDATETRLALLEKLKTKYGASLTEVLQYAENLRTELAQLERAASDAAHLEAQLEDLRADLETRAQVLTNARIEGANRITPKLEGVIRKLGMPKARLEFALHRIAPSSTGAEEIEIRFSANPGEDLGGLAKIASGGELSRVMLALCTVLGANTPTVIFDEVDAGIGGLAAQAVADQLGQLAKHHQVLVVTHLAQIAAKAQHHFKVEKREKDGRTVTRVVRLEGESRIKELARMLSGSDSSTAIAHARELLGLQTA
jgi:DNA repair protein RecN (Recombination protein N)